MTRTGNKARATTPSTKSPPNPYPGVPHYPPRTQIRAPHSDTQQTTTCTSGQAKEEKYRHTKATQGTEPNTPHLGGTPSRPTRYVTSSHLHTPGVPHQAEANKEQPATTPRRRPTRRPPPGQAKPDRQRHRTPPNDTDTQHNQPDQQASDPTRHQHPDNHPKGITPTHNRVHTPTRPRGQGNPQQATRHPNPQGRTPT